MVALKSPPAFPAPAGPGGPAGGNDGDDDRGRTRGDGGGDRARDYRPFLTAAREYVGAVRPYYRESTLERTWRDLVTIERDLRAIQASPQDDRNGWPVPRNRAGFRGDVEEASSASSPRYSQALKSGQRQTLKSSWGQRPADLDEAAVAELLLRWRTRPARGREGPLDASSQAHLVKVLGNFLAWLGNPVLERMRRQRHVRLPREIPKPVHVLTDPELQRLWACDVLGGWRGRVGRFLSVFLSATGLRPGEVRQARLEDLDLARRVIVVVHPKGEGSWAAAGLEAPVLEFALQEVRDFLADREDYLAGGECEALVPLRSWDGRLGPWSEAGLRKLVADLREASGVRFSLKTFRATFAQRAVDAGVPIEVVSRALRHASTKTTERWYARVRTDAAFAQLHAAFSVAGTDFYRVRPDKFPGSMEGAAPVGIRCLHSLGALCPLSPIPRRLALTAGRLFSTPPR